VNSGLGTGQMALSKGGGTAWGSTGSSSGVSATWGGGVSGDSEALQDMSNQLSYGCHEVLN
jgi:hypothetical protein